MAWEDLNESERGYIAGFLDGEGSILLTRHTVINSKLKCRPTVAFYNTNKEVIGWIGSVIGVKYNKRMIDTRRDKRHQRNNYSLQIRKYDQVYKFLIQILPYLRIKKRNAEIVISFCEEVLFRSNYCYTDEQIETSESYYSELKDITSYKGGDYH